MEYSKLRNKVKKFYGGGSLDFTEIQRQVQGLGFDSLSPQQKQLYLQGIEQESGFMEQEADDALVQSNLSNVQQQTNQLSDQLRSQQRNNDVQNLVNSDPLVKQEQKNEKLTNLASKFGVDSSFIGEGPGQMSAGGAVATGIIGQVGVGAMKAIDNLAMGDKNFGAQSQAIDSAVHGISGALMSSGNPYAMAAGAALEGANFLTKAGGQTVQGFDVNIENSGFGTTGHMESTSSRDWGAFIGLGGVFNKNIERKLAKRNEQARMAMQAAEISDDIKFEQEARMNSVDNILRNNQIALAGGVDVNLLGN